MTAQRENYRCINGVIVPTVRTGRHMKNMALDVEAGATGLRGGERDAGCRSYLRLTWPEGMDMYARTMEDGVEIVTSGDSSLVAMMEGLLFALDVICGTAAEVKK